MRVIFMGTPDFSVGTLRALVEAGHEVVAVVSQPDKPKGRGKALQPTPVKEAALELGLPVLQPKRIREPEVLQELQALRADVIVVVAFGQIIPKAILNLTPYGCINVHASLLPKYRGAAPIQWAVIDGEETSGVTIMRMDEGLDTGDMISKVEVPLAADETGGSLFDKLSAAGAQLLVDTLPSLLDGTAVVTPQPAQSPTAYASMMTKQMGNLNFSRPAAELERLIRGLNPWPSAYTRLNGKNLKIWKAHVVKAEEICENTENDGMIGTVVSIDNEPLCIRTVKGYLAVDELQLEGKKRMDAAAFLRGHSDLEGKTLPC